MQILKSIDPAAATGGTKQIFDGAQKALGTVPNLFRVVANSPAALKAYTSFDGALSHGALTAQLREQVAIAVANANRCDYCLSAHTVLGAVHGVPAADLELARDAQSSDQRTAAALRFATAVVRNRGIVPAPEIDAVKAAGFSDGEIVELVAVVAVNIFTNYLNNIAGTEIDFPVIHTSGR